MAVITAAEARFYLRGLTGTGEDTDIATCVTRVDAALAAWLGFPPRDEATDPTLEDVSYVLYLDGPGGLVVQSPVWPIQSVTSIYDDPDRSYDAASLVAATDYDLDKPVGKIILSNSAVWGSWSSSWRAIKLTVVAGWTTIPERLKHAVGLTVRHQWRARDLAGVETMTGSSGMSASLRPFTILPEVQQLLAADRLPGGWVG